jgi:hypothetical protein
MTRIKAKLRRMEPSYFVAAAAVAMLVGGVRLHMSGDTAHAAVFFAISWACWVQADYSSMLRRARLEALEATQRERETRKLLNQALGLVRDSQAQTEVALAMAERVSGDEQLATLRALAGESEAEA